MNIKKSHMTWRSSFNTPGWEFVRLSGEHAGPFTVLCRCASAVTYAPWISDGLVEYYVLQGILWVNNMELNEGDYGSVEPRTDGHLSTKEKMEALCIVHGKIIWAKEVFDSLRNHSLSAQDAKAFLSLPWIDHLRRHLSDDLLDSICYFMDEQPDEEVKEFCISVARNLKSNRLITAAKNVLQLQPGMSLRVTATLYLASKGEADSSLWQIQLQKMKECPEELLRVVSAFYSARTNEELLNAIRQRLASGRYDYNKPFYDMVSCLAERSASNSCG